MISISTAWNYHHGGDMRQMLLAIRDTGFDTVELGYKIRVEELAQIIPLLKEFGLNVSSVHNFCPVPNDHPSPRHPSNYYRLSSLDEAERQLAVKWTREAINTAVVTKAKVVVIHAGTVELPEDLAEGMFKKYKESGHGADAFAGLRERFMKERTSARGPFMDSVKRSLSEILSYAATKNVKIGLESRYYPTEIPNSDEVGELLDQFHHQGLWYWHDVGHSEVNERLGIYHHLDTLRKYGSRLIGFHLHGVKILKDHQAPFEGDFDLKTIFPFMKKEHIKVIESHGSATATQIQEALSELKTLENQL